MLSEWISDCNIIEDSYNISRSFWVFLIFFFYWLLRNIRVGVKPSLELHELLIYVYPGFYEPLFKLINICALNYWTLASIWDPYIYCMIYRKCWMVPSSTLLPTGTFRQTNYNRLGNTQPHTCTVDYWQSLKRYILYTFLGVCKINDIDSEMGDLRIIFHFAHLQIM